MHVTWTGSAPATLVGHSAVLHTTSHMRGLQADEVVAEVGNILSELADTLPLLEMLLNPALCPRHWVTLLDTVSPTALASFCPVELQRRSRAAEAAAAGAQADLSQLVRCRCADAGRWSTPCVYIYISWPTRAASDLAVCAAEGSPHTPLVTPHEMHKQTEAVDERSQSHLTLISIRPCQA
jgi:hypothetical protein